MADMSGFGVIFDMDGTIIDNEVLSISMFKDFFKEQNVIFNNDIVKACMGAKDGLWTAILKFNPKADIESLREGLKEYRSKRPLNYKELMRPNMKVLLKGLKERGFKVAVASSTSMAGVKRNLTQCEILDEFHTIVSGDMIVKGKPNPEIYLYCCEKLGLEPENCIAIEDSQNGLISAKKAGMKAIALTDRHFGFDLSSADRIMDFTDLTVEKIEHILMKDKNQISIKNFRRP